MNETKNYDKSIHSNPDATAWAKLYKEKFPEADLDTMRGWFANAMMAMFDHIHQTKNVTDKQELKRIPKVSHNVVNPNGSIDVFFEDKDLLPINFEPTTKKV